MLDDCVNEKRRGQPADPQEKFVDSRKILLRRGVQGAYLGVAVITIAFPSIIHSAVGRFWLARRPAEVR